VNASDSALFWRKSSHSSPEGAQCVELAAFPTGVGIRDSKRPEAGHLRVSRSAIAGLLLKVAESARSLEDL
jgi:hypothetical protein